MVSRSRIRRRMLAAAAARADFETRLAGRRAARAANSERSKASAEARRSKLADDPLYQERAVR